jgi:hypothetical protein
MDFTCRLPRIRRLPLFSIVFTALFGVRTTFVFSSANCFVLVLKVFTGFGGESWPLVDANDSSPGFNVVSVVLGLFLVGFRFFLEKKTAQLVWEVSRKSLSSSYK